MPEPESPPAEPSFIGSLQISSPRRFIFFAACFGVALGASMLAQATSDLSMAGTRALFILVFASTLWVSEAIPPFATGILIIGLKILLLGDPNEGVFAETDRDWEAFVLVLGHPLVWLFFGGFVMAAGMARTGLDRQLARTVLGRMGDRPPMVLLGVMAITFGLSMFVSNTATTAMMMAMLAPLLAGMPVSDRYARGLLLGIAVAANLGGMGSLIGTPPNAIAVGALADLSEPMSISFLEWMMLGLPPALVLLAISWVAIMRLYPASTDRLEMSRITGEGGDDVPREPVWRRLVVGFGLLATVGMWLTTQWHGIPAAAISFIPIVLFTATGVLGAEQLRGLSWDVIFLLAGGLALGETVTQTGLSDWLVGHLPYEGLGVVGVAALMAITTVVLSNFMSNTAAANVLIPLGATMAAGHEATVAIPIALAASLAMCLPISTPPNAMVFSSGRCETRDFLYFGLFLGLIGPVVAIVYLIFAFPVVLPGG